MEDVKIHFWKGTGAVGRIIRWRTWGPYSHVGMEVDKMFYDFREMRTPAAKEWDLEKNAGLFDPKYGSPDKTLYLPRVDENTRERMKAWWKGKIEKKRKYDYWMVIMGFLFRSKEKADTKNKYFCSEAVADCCRECDRPLFSRVDGSKIDPSMVSYSLELQCLPSNIQTPRTKL